SRGRPGRRRRACGWAATPRSRTPLLRARRGLRVLVEPRLALDAGAIGGAEGATLDGAGQRARRQDLDARLRREVAMHEARDYDRVRCDVGVHPSFGTDV